MAAIKPPTILLNSLDMLKSMEKTLRTARRMHLVGQTIVLVPAENAEAWLEFLGKIIMATEARKGKEHNNGK